MEYPYPNFCLCVFWGPINPRILNPRSPGALCTDPRCSSATSRGLSEGTMEVHGEL